MDSAGDDDNAVRQHAGSLLAYHMLSIARERFSCAPAGLNAQQQREARQIALRQMLIEDAVLKSREAAGVVVPPAQVAEARERILERYRGEDGVPDALAMSGELESCGIDEAGFAAALERQLRVECVLERVSALLPAVEETEVRLFYYMHPGEFVTPEWRVVRQILITVNDDFPENARAAAAARMAVIASRVRLRPERFAEQAMKHSECPSAMNGGQLGRVTRGQLFPSLDECLFQMCEGEISPVIESELGFHLLLCEAVIASRTPPLAEIYDALKEKLEQRQRVSFQKRWLRSQLKPADHSGPDATASEERCING